MEKKAGICGITRHSRGTHKARFKAQKTAKKEVFVTARLSMGLRSIFCPEVPVFWCGRGEGRK
jgi:hypothetical protein